MKKSIPSHEVTADYSYHMNGADHKNRDTADYTVSLKSNRFYMQIFCWLFDGILHAMCSVIKAVGSDKGTLGINTATSIWGDTSFKWTWEMI
jgi:hypothetical protein